MSSIIYFGSIFLAKVLDNALSTTKTILIQRSRWLLAGIAVVISDFIYLRDRHAPKSELARDFGDAREPWMLASKVSG